MHISSKTLIFFLPLVLAQYGPPADSSTTSSVAAAAGAASTTSSSSSTQTVMVGAKNALAFSPNVITANVGTKIEFVFSPPLHSVVEGSFASPCAPLANGTGFFSGGFTTTSGTNAKAFTITINDTNPIWFYCGVPTHCESGMAGVINPPSDGSATLAQYVAAAAKVSNAPAAPSVIQGGTVGPVKAQTSGSSTSSVAPSASTSSSGAGLRAIETGGTVQLIMITLTGIFSLVAGGFFL